jgi:hypothetical protein
VAAVAEFGSLGQIVPHSSKNPEAMKTNAAFLIVILLLVTGCCTSSIIHRSGPSKGDTITSATGIVLKSSDGDRLVTPGVFHPPLEITLVAKTDSTNLRMGYAADQVIFNWEGDMEQLRMDGGPANGRHKAGAGRIPKDRYVTIRWVVMPTNQAIYVNDDLRFDHTGDYSHLNRNVSVFPSQGSTVTVKSLAVRQIGGRSQ